MASATSEHVTLLAPDISCAHCVATVQGALSQQAGVTRAQASAETKLVNVEYDPAVVTLTQITETLAVAGYPVKA